MRIVSVCRVLPTPDDASAGTFVIRRLAAMARLASVRVLQPVPYFPFIRSLPSWVGDGPYRTGDLGIEHAPMLYLPGVLKSLDGRWLARSIGSRLRSLRSEGQVDVIDAHFGYPDGVGCVRVARRLGLPVFVTVRGMETDCLKVPLLRLQLVDALRQATGCISVSHSLKELIADHGVDRSRVLVVPNAIDRTVFHPGDRADARARLGLSMAKRIIVSVGHLISGKRHDVLIRALHRLRQRDRNAELVIIGGRAYEAGHPERLAQLAVEVGVADAVRFAGKVSPEQVALWLQAADVFALGTAREGCCNAVLEALAVGLPVVTTPVGDNAHYVLGDTNGSLVPVGDVEATAAAFEDALGRHWDRQLIARSLPVGDWNSVARKIIDFFGEQIRADTRGSIASEGMA